MRAILPLVALLLVGACSKSEATAPSQSPDAWASGDWVAVRMNDKPLPYQDAPNYPYVMYDSLAVGILLIPPSAPRASMFPYQTLHFNAQFAPEPIICVEGLGYATITMTSLATHASGAFTSVGNCNVNHVEFNFTRITGDTLFGIWGSASVKLVKR